MGRRGLLSEVGDKLRRRGVHYPGRLTWFPDKEGRIATDKTAAVVKLLGGHRDAEVYLEDLAAFEEAGIRAETALLQEPFRLSTQAWCIAVRFERSDPWPEDAPEQVGRLVRDVHDRVWAAVQHQGAGDLVYDVDDWSRQNLVFRDGRPVPIDLDMAGTYPRWRAVAFAVEGFTGPRRQDRPRILAGYNFDHKYDGHEEFEKLRRLYGTA